jgi:hypothetical protein
MHACCNIHSFSFFPFASNIITIHALNPQLLKQDRPAVKDDFRPFQVHLALCARVSEEEEEEEKDEEEGVGMHAYRQIHKCVGS